MIGELTTEEKALLDRIVGQVDFAHDGLHKHWRRRWDHLDGLYNNYDDLARSVAQSGPRDRDSIAGDARREFGAELFIPHSFAMVELVVARTLATPPKMLFLPKRADAFAVRDHIRGLFACQQDDINYELVLQSAGKNGQIYNLGVVKNFWRKEVRDARSLEYVSGQWVVGNDRPVKVFDGPVSESIDPYDWIWDPWGTTLGSLRWSVHRTWRSDHYVLQKLGLLDGQDPQTASWRALEGRLEREDVEGLNSTARFTQVKQGRSTSRGMSAEPSATMAGATPGRGGKVHEVWEFHDAETKRVAVILDRKLPVAQGAFPNWRGDSAFEIYRPSEVPGQIPGKGAIEPSEDLQRDTNMLRTNRQWNALLKLHQTYAYNDGVVDPDDIKIGPGALVGVNGDPNGLLAPLTTGDIPPSSYNEEQALLADFFRTSGLQDPNEQSAAPETATGVQLVQQATQARTWLTTRRAALEIVKPSAKYWLQLNKQRILDPVPVRIPQAPGSPSDLPYNFLEVGPDELQKAEFDIEIEGGLEAENVAQDRQDAQMLFGLAQNPQLDGMKMLILGLEKCGLRDVEQYLAPQSQSVDPDVVFKSLTDLGVPQDIATDAVRAAVNVKQQDQGGGGQ